MQKITTSDGSETFYNQEYDDIYHSKSGAIEEAVKKFIGPCRIREKAKSGRVAILDICFGLGYNSCAAIDAALDENKSCIISITALEKHMDILRQIRSVSPNLKSYGMIREIAEMAEEREKIDEIRRKSMTEHGSKDHEYMDRGNDHMLTVEKGNITLTLIIGDATATIRRIKQGQMHTTFDAVFHDPFSPKKNPELWTGEFFRDVRKLMKDGAVLATYSCARIVRDNMKAAGFMVMDGPAVGRRAPATIGANP